MLLIPELLAPAGSLECLNAAVREGADAVYLGLDDFNARKGAANFTIDSLKEACDYAHARGVKVYVTLNTLIITRELKPALLMVERALCAGADAFIVQDIGLANEISRVVGEDYLHVSTQVNIHNVAGVQVCKALGAKRITLARELSLEEIDNISSEAHALGMEIECFAHGAICVCYSGQCLMSSCIGARSANRGLCAQPCRLQWNLIEGDGAKQRLKCEGKHLLSTKDMCTINDLSKLAKAGVDSLKIEGRMKSPEYVASVVRVYRSILNRMEVEEDPNPTKAQIESLKASFSRGFTNGYLFGERGRDLMSFDRPNNRGLFVGRVKSKRIFGERSTQLEIDLEADLKPKDTINVWTKHGGVVLKVPEDVSMSGKGVKFRTNVNVKDVREKDRVFRVRTADQEFRLDLLEPKIPVSAKLKLKLGEPVEIHVTSGGKGVSVKGEVAEAARTKAVTKEEIIEHFNRLGKTDFKCENIDVELDDNVGIGFSAIHKLRSHALDELYENLAETRTSKVKFNVKEAETVKHESSAQICAIVTNADDARFVSRAGVLPYVSALNHKLGQASRAGVLLSTNTQATYPNDVVIVNPIVAHDAVGKSRECKLKFGLDEQVSGAKRVYCDDFANALIAKQRGQAFEIGQFVPVTNSCSIDVINRLEPQIVWLSPELNLKQIEEIAPKIKCDVGIFVYGKQRLMTCEHCFLMSMGNCAEDCSSCRKRSVKHSLVDRKEVSFPVVSDCLGRSTIYNSVTLDLTPNLDDLIKCGVNRFMIDATLLDETELKGTVSRVKEALKDNPKKRSTNSTSGHLFRGV